MFSAGTTNRLPLVILGIVIVLGLVAVVIHLYPSTGQRQSPSSSAYTTSDQTIASSSVYSTTIMPNTTAPTSTLNETPKSPITHVIVIFQENRAFDNYFGTYPGADGLNLSTCIPVNLTNASQGCVTPFELTAPSTIDLPHQYNSTQEVINNGSMNGFIQSAGGCEMPMGYYTNATIPYLWAYAEHYTLADHTFSSFEGWSIPAHWAMIAALAPFIGFFSKISNQSNYTVKTEYTQEADSIPTITQLMSNSNSNVTWKYYDTYIPVGEYQRSFNNGSIIDLWDPFKALSSSYTANESQHFVIRGKIYDDINQGTLPNVSWVIPSPPISDHAPANVTWGMWWIASIVNYVGESRYWNNTVIIVTWDDYGGWYDGVDPPQINSSTNITGTEAKGAGLRVPMLIISPYSRPGYVDHTVYTFSSIMKYIEQNFGLPALNVRDRTANSIIGALNYSQAPLPPLIEPENLTQQNIVNTWAYSPTGPLNPVANVTGPCETLQLATLRSSIGTEDRGYIDGDPD